MASQSINVLFILCLWKGVSNSIEGWRIYCCPVKQYRRTFSGRWSSCLLQVNDIIIIGPRPVHYLGPRTQVCKSLWMSLRITLWSYQFYTWASIFWSLFIVINILSLVWLICGFLYVCNKCNKAVFARISFHEEGMDMKLHTFSPSGFNISKSPLFASSANLLVR